MSIEIGESGVLIGRRRGGLSGGCLVLIDTHVVTVAVS